MGLNCPLLWQHRMQGDGGRAQLFAEYRSNLFPTLPFLSQCIFGTKKKRFQIDTSAHFSTVQQSASISHQMREALVVDFIIIILPCSSCIFFCAFHLLALNSQQVLQPMRFQECEYSVCVRLCVCVCVCKDVKRGFWKAGFLKLLPFMMWKWAPHAFSL